MKRMFSLWLVLVALLVAAFSQQQQPRMVKVSRVNAIQTLDRQIVAITTQLNELNGMRNAWVLTDADSVFVPEAWTK